MGCGGRATAWQMRTHPIPPPETAGTNTPPRPQRLTAGHRAMGIGGLRRGISRRVLARAAGNVLRQGGKPGKGGKGGRGGRRQGRAARAEAKKKKKEAESQPEPEPEPEPSMSDDLAQTVATAAAAAATAASEAAIARVLREHQIGTTDGANASAATAAPSPAPSAPAEGTPPSSVDIVAAVRDAMTR